MLCAPNSPKLRTSNEEYDKYEAMLDNGVDLARLKYNEIRPLRRDLQIIFQDPYSSLNPRMTVGQIIEEGLTTHNFYRHGSKAMKDYIFSQANGNTQFNLNAEKVSNFVFCFPPLSEQQAIASYLDEKTSQIDSLIALKQEKITELKDYKKSIIYEYVTGKKKV